MIDPIYDDKTHRRALLRIETLWDARPGTREGREFDALATLIDAYEATRFPILPLDPIEAIRARAEDLGWTRKELEPLIGSRARVSEVLSRRRPLTLAMIRRLHAAMQLPLETLVGEVAAEAKGRRRKRAA